MTALIASPSNSKKLKVRSPCGGLAQLNHLKPRYLESKVTVFNFDENSVQSHKTFHPNRITPKVYAFKTSSSRVGFKIYGFAYVLILIKQQCFYAKSLVLVSNCVLMNEYPRQNMRNYHTRPWSIVNSFLAQRT